MYNKLSVGRDVCHLKLTSACDCVECMQAYQCRLICQLLSQKSCGSRGSVKAHNSAIYTIIVLKQRRPYIRAADGTNWYKRAHVTSKYNIRNHGASQDILIWSGYCMTKLISRTTAYHVLSVQTRQVYFGFIRIVFTRYFFVIQFFYYTIKVVHVGRTLMSDFCSLWML